jgi:hypothetical protein
MTKLGEHLSEEAKRKISEAKKKNPIRFWLGKKRPDISQKISEANKGKHFSPKTEFKKGDVAPFKGRKHTEEWRQKASIAHKGQGLGNKYAKGIKHTDEWKKAMSLRTKGNHFAKGMRPNSTSFKKGLVPWNKGRGNPTESHRIRTSLEYKLWRTAVFERDNYTCIWCGDNRGGNLEADHIKPFVDYPELRFAIDNGRTLCHNCHKTTETYGFRRRTQS